MKEQQTKALGELERKLYIVEKTLIKEQKDSTEKMEIKLTSWRIT
jgi:hypothetical protein